MQAASATFSLRKTNAQWLAGFFLLTTTETGHGNCFTDRIRQKKEELWEQGHILNYLLNKQHTIPNRLQQTLKAFFIQIKPEVTLLRTAELNLQR